MLNWQTSDEKPACGGHAVVTAIILQVHEPKWLQQESNDQTEYTRVCHKESAHVVKNLDLISTAVSGKLNEGAAGP